jgi:hypothetical protein
LTELLVEPFEFERVSFSEAQERRRIPFQSTRFFWVREGVISRN